MLIWIDSAKADGSDKTSTEGFVEVDALNDFHKLIKDPERDYAFQYRNSSDYVSMIFYKCSCKRFYYFGFPENSPIPPAEIEAFPGIQPWPTEETA